MPLGVDWTTDLSEARQAVEGRVALQGNLDPSALFAPPETLARGNPARARQLRRRRRTRIQFGARHHPDVDPERVALLIETVQSYSLPKLA